MYGPKNKICRNVYAVTGVIKLAGSKLKPKAKCTDRVIGTRKGIKRTVSRRRKISGRIDTEK